MKNALMIAIMFVLLTNISQAVSTVVTTGYYNKYLGFSSGSVIHNEPVIQSSLDFYFDNGINIGFWNSTSPDGEENFGDEIDYKLAWSGKISENWNLCLTVAYFDEPSVGKFGPDDIWFFETAASRPLGKYSIGFKIKNYLTTSGSSYKGGWIFESNISRSFKLTDNLSVFCKIAGRYDDGVVFGSSGFLLDGFASVNLKINETFSWDIVQIHGFVPLMKDSRETDATFGTALIAKF